MQSLDCPCIAIAFQSKLGYWNHGRVRNINENFLSIGDTTSACPIGYVSILSMVHHLIHAQEKGCNAWGGMHRKHIMANTHKLGERAFDIKCAFKLSGHCNCFQK